MNLFLLQAASLGGSFGPILLFGGMFLVMYLFIIRPQQKRQKEEQTFRSGLQKGDKVRTIGGIHGTVDSIDETTVMLRVDDHIKLRFDKTAIVKA